MNPDSASRYPRLAEVFGIDLRTLALFRVALAGVLTCSLLSMLCNLGAFWTDAGVLPRAWLAASDSAFRLSLHLANGQAWFIALLLCAQIVLALMMLLGCRTRMATVLSFVLWASLLNRNPAVIAHGDVLLACLLFWAMFLPTAARFSMDAARTAQAAPLPSLYLSWGTLGLLVQIMSVYFFGALLKSGAAWSGDHTALYYALSIDRIALAPGRWLNGSLALTQGLTVAIRWLELLGPLLIFAPIFLRPLRLAVMLAFALMHLLLWLCLDLGNWPVVCLAALTAFTGSWLWDRAALRQQRRHPGPLRIYYDRDCAFCLSACRLLQQFLILPQAQIVPAQDNPRARTLLEANRSWVVIDADESAHLKWQAFATLLRHSPLLGWLWWLARRPAIDAIGNRLYERIGQQRGRLGAITRCVLPPAEPQWEPARFWRGFAGIAVLLVLMWNLSTVHALPAGVQTALAPLLRVLRIDQSWDLFAPQPTRDDGWLVIPGRLADGREIDLLHPSRAPSHARPQGLVRDHEDFRWRLYLGRLTEPAYQQHRAYYGRYLCQRWNAPLSRQDREQRLMTFKMIHMLERTPPPGHEAPVEQVVIWRHECFPEETRGQIP